MNDAKQLAVADGNVRIVLPGTWVRVPVTNGDDAAAFAKRFVRRQMGRADRAARVRREAAQELVASARDAAAIGVHTYLMALEILPGVPFSAALLIRDSEWPDTSHLALEQDDIAAALTDGFSQVEVSTGRYGPVGRRWEFVRQSVTEGGEDFLTLRLEYFLPVPGRAGLLMVRANVANVPSAEPFSTLFDEMVDSITFVDADDPEAREV